MHSFSLDQTSTQQQSVSFQSNKTPRLNRFK
jgi:hypothetical protein